MHGPGLAASLEREVPGRTWKDLDPLPTGPQTHQTVRAGLEKALREGNGVAIVQAYKPKPDGTAYAHWVVVRGLRGGNALIHDPENGKAVLKMITAEGFGDYYWTGDTVLAASKQP